MSKIEAVILDMDGLMFDTEMMYYEANQRTLDEMEIPFDKEMYMNVVGSAGEHFYNGMLEIVKTDDNFQEFIEHSDTLFLHRIENETVRVKPGLYNLINYLEKEAIPRYVASSSDRNIIEILLDSTGFHHRINGIVAGDEVERNKPHPEAFNKAWKLAKKPAKEATWILEDSLNGVRAAHAGGFPCIMVPDLLTPDEEAKQLATEIMPDLYAVKSYFEENK